MLGTAKPSPVPQAHHLLVCLNKAKGIPQSEIQENNYCSCLRGVVIIFRLCLLNTNMYKSDVQCDWQKLNTSGTVSNRNFCF